MSHRFISYWCSYTFISLTHSCDQGGYLLKAFQELGVDCFIPPFCAGKGKVHSFIRNASDISRIQELIPLKFPLKIL
jgi:hypothetical protein